MKENVFANSHQTLADLKETISEENRRVDAAALKRETDSLFSLSSAAWLPTKII